MRRIVSYRPRGTRQALRAGIETAAGVVDVCQCGGPVSVRRLLQLGEEAVHDIATQAERMPQIALPAADLEIGPPIPDPEKIVCLGLNYADHAAEAGLSTPPVPILFAKFANALVGPRADIRLPRLSSEVDYEGELAVIVGRECHDVAREAADKVIAGYAVMNDVSARDLQRQTTQWTAGKALDTFAPIGPGIVPASDIAEPHGLKLRTRVNGNVVQEASTSEMIFDIPRIIEYISSFMTLVPGDVIATGTPAGVGFKRQPPIFLVDGDVIEVEIDRLGRIENRAVSMAG